MQQSKWNQLLGRLSVRLSLGFIALCLLLAVFAYPLSPDSSQHANRKIPELTARPPGFAKYFLQVPLSKPAEAKSSREAFFNGSDVNETLIPINQILFRGDSFAIVHYISAKKQDTIFYANKTLLSASAGSKNIDEQRAIIGKDYISHHRFYLGTDRYGRDILSRLLIGTRSSLFTGFVAAAIAFGIALLVGVLSGYHRGRAGRLSAFLIHLFSCIPAVLLVFAITWILNRNPAYLPLAIGLGMSPVAALRIRDRVSCLRDSQFIGASRLMGLSELRILFRHLLPNLKGLLLKLAVSGVASAILLEAGLSFLGIGVPAPMPSWGMMIKEHSNFLALGRPLPVLLPGILIFLLAAAFLVLSKALGDVYAEEKPVEI